MLFIFRILWGIFLAQTPTVTKRVEGKVALVTGAASNPGIGNTIAKRLADEGAKVVVTDIDLAGAQRCADQIIANGGAAFALEHNVVSEQQWSEVVSKTAERYGRLDILVNNAGIALVEPLVDTTMMQWNNIIDINLTGVFLGCKYGVLEMRKHGGGAIINMSSIAATIGISKCAAYSATKGGVTYMSKSIAIEEAENNIRCNTIHPGVIWTSLQVGVVGADDPSLLNTSSERIPLGRHGVPDDIAGMAVFLASNEANYITGAEFVIDAGMSVQ